MSGLIDRQMKRLTDVGFAIEPQGGFMIVTDRRRKKLGEISAHDPVKLVTQVDAFLEKYPFESASSGASLKQEARVDIEALRRGRLEGLETMLEGLADRPAAAEAAKRLAPLIFAVLDEAFVMWNERLIRNDTKAVAALLSTYFALNVRAHVELLCQPKQQVGGPPTKSDMMTIITGFMGPLAAEFARLGIKVPIEIDG